MRKGGWQYWLVTGWAILWFVVISPAHQRGAIELPMTAWQKAQLKQAATKPVSSCCAHAQAGVLADGPTQSNTTPQKPAPNPKRCAVCHINMLLPQVPVLHITLPELGLLAVSIPALVCDLVEQIEHPNTGDARAPPHIIRL